MTSAQKVIKYIAIALAIAIIVNIIAAIYFGFATFASVLGLNHSSNSKTLHELNINSSEVTSLDIDVAATNLIIKTGRTLKIETNNDHITLRQPEGKLLIEEKELRWFTKNEKSELVIYLPEDMKFDEVDIDTGAGKVDIEQLKSKKLSFDFGAGKVNIQKLYVSEETKISSGAGEINILSGDIHQLDADMGIGCFTLTASLTGTTEIDAGIGEVDINVLGKEEDYRMKVSKGIGSIRIAGKNISDDTIYGNGMNTIEVDGGVGSISLDFQK